MSFGRYAWAIFFLFLWTDSVSGQLLGEQTNQPSNGAPDFTKANRSEGTAIEASLDRLVRREFDVRENELLKKYTDVLERTNQQIGLSFVPMNLFVTSLGVLFAIAAIYMTIFFFMQSSDYKNRLKEQEGQYIAAFKDMTKNYDLVFLKIRQDFEKFRESVEIELKKLLTDSEKQLETATGEARADVQKTIADLTVKIQEVKSTPVPSPVKSPFLPPSNPSGTLAATAPSGSFTSPSLKGNPVWGQCPRCAGTIFWSQVTPGSSIGTYNITCPYCLTALV
jgi:hypothetical protein